MKKLSFKFPGSRGLPGNEPSREWGAMLSAFSVVTLCCFAFGAYLVYVISNDKFALSGGVADSSSALFDEKALLSVIAGYESAPERISNLLAEGKLFVDPSK